MTAIFTPFLKIFGAVIEFCYNICGENYLLAIILFALIVKIVMLPFSIFQQKNSIKQAKLRPKEMAIRKKYAGRNDQATQQKVQNEIMELYQKENFNPMTGCLPMLLQLPILLGIYEVIRKPLIYMYDVPAENIKKLVDEGLKKTNGLWQIFNDKLLTEKNAKDIEDIVEKAIKDINNQHFKLIDVLRDHFDEFKEYLGDGIEAVADLPDFTIFNGFLNLSDTPSFSFEPENLVLLLVPVLTFVFMFFSMKINKKFTYNANEGVGGDAAKSMQIMDWIMPLMSVWITFMVPAVIGIYWIFNNIFGTVQQIILAKVMPIPKFTDEDYKNAEKEMNGKKKPEKKKADNQNGEKKKVRSLHRIDDEDYVAPAPEPKKKKAEKQGGLAGMIDQPEVKDTDKE